jgi:hypothetical protein
VRGRACAQDLVCDFMCGAVRVCAQDLVGDERWRQSAVAAHVSYSEDGTSGYRRCRIQSAGAFFSRACDEDEVSTSPMPLM